MKRLILLIGLFMTLPSWAEESLAEPPRLPEPQQSGEALDPEVTIVETSKGTVHEYRANGQLYMVKIVPRVGAAYYMIDTNGDGEMDAREDDIRSVATPQWVLLSW